jgi:hypothetical protein
MALWRREDPFDIYNSWFTMAYHAGPLDPSDPDAYHLCGYCQYDDIPIFAGWPTWHDDQHIAILEARIWAALPYTAAMLCPWCYFLSFFQFAPRYSSLRPPRNLIIPRAEYYGDLSTLPH